MSTPLRFQNRADAALRLAAQMRSRKFRNPLVLAIPRGGVVTGAVLARELGAELDVVLSRKLRAPSQPELAVGAISEDGQVYLDSNSEDALGVLDGNLGEEHKHQLAEIARRKKMIRAIRPQATIVGRSVIVTDDGIATGSTMIAALQAIRPRHPHELIVAVPVASPDRLRKVGKWCDETICLLPSEHFWAIGQFYDDFSPVEDEQMLKLLREFAAPASEASPARSAQT